MTLTTKQRHGMHLAGWRVLVVMVAMLALTGSLATRVFHVNGAQPVSAQSAASSATRQHLDRDAVRWAPPVAEFNPLYDVSFYPRISPAGPPVPAVLIDESLYNRPPPTC